VLSGQDMTTAAAMTKLMWLFGQFEADPAAVRTAFRTPLVGEMLGNDRHTVLGL
jgi:hypothetical protein